MVLMFYTLSCQLGTRKEGVLQKGVKEKREYYKRKWAYVCYKLTEMKNRRPK